MTLFYLRIRSSSAKGQCREALISTRSLAPSDLSGRLRASASSRAYFAGTFRRGAAGSLRVAELRRAVSALHRASSARPHVGLCRVASRRGVARLASPRVRAPRVAGPACACLAVPAYARMPSADGVANSIISDRNRPRRAPPERESVRLMQSGARARYGCAEARRKRSGGVAGGGLSAVLVTLLYLIAR
jgi:hypothetical protein